jgi:hypothetical protein
MMTSALHRTETERWRGELSSSRPAYSDEPALGRLGILGLGVAWHDKQHDAWRLIGIRVVVK